MCGIRVAGENRFAIAPLPGGSLTHAEAAYNSVYGMVRSSWTREEGKTVFSVTVPANCTAEVCLPGGTKQTVPAGEYRFTEG